MNVHIGGSGVWSDKALENVSYPMRESFSKCFSILLIHYTKTFISAVLIPGHVTFRPIPCCVNNYRKLTVPHLARITTDREYIDEFSKQSLMIFKFVSRYAFFQCVFCEHILFG